MTKGARAQLQADSAAIRQAVQAREVANASTALAKLRADLTGLEANREVSASAGAKVLQAASQVQASLALITTTTVPTTTVPTNTSPPATATSPGSAPPPAPGPGRPGKGGGKDHHGHGDS